MKQVLLKQKRAEQFQPFHQFLLLAGVLASLLYIIANIVCVMSYDGYSAITQTVSELSAIGAPTRTLWITLLIPYSVLMIGFGFGVLLSGENNRRLRIVGILIIINSVIGSFWPPMHQREVLAAGGGTLTDILHIAFTFITVPMMMLQIIVGATALGKSFRFYSMATLFILVMAGIFTGIDAPKIATNEPTPFIGFWERINIGIYMLWIVVLSIDLVKQKQGAIKTKEMVSAKLHKATAIKS
jgi:hypothetical protein